MAEEIKLNKVEIFSELTPAEIREFAASLRRLSLQKDEILFSEGDGGNELFIVGSGSLGVSVKTQDGTDLDVAEFGPGDFF